MASCFVLAHPEWSRVDVNRAAISVSAAILFIDSLPVPVNNVPSNGPPSSRKYSMHLF